MVVTKFVTKRGSAEVASLETFSCVRVIVSRVIDPRADTTGALDTRPEVAGHTRTRS